MKSTCLLFLFIVLHYNFIYAAPVKLLEAKKQKKVSVKSIGNGGHMGECISLTVKNLTALKQDIIVNPGLIFTSLDSSAQNLMAVEEYTLVLMPGASKTLNVYTMCIEAHDHSPYVNSLFDLNKEATGELLALAIMIANKDYRNSTAQSAIWALTDNNSLDEIYATDTTMAGQLANYVSTATGRPRPQIITPKEHYIYSINMNMSCYIAKPTRITLACYDSSGNVIKEYYKNKVVGTGLYIANFSVNKVADKGTKFIYRLTDDKGMVLKERIFTESVNEPKAEKWLLNVNFEYVLKAPVPASTMSIYDDQGNLIENLYTNRNLPAGGRRQTYAFYHTAGKNSIFYFRLKDNTGKVILEQKIDGSKSVKVL